MGTWQLKTLKDGTQAYRYQGDDGKWYKNDEEGGTGPKSAQPTPSPITDRELQWDERMRYALAADKPATQLDALKRLGYGAEEVDGEVIAIDPKTGERFRPDSKDLNWKDALDLPAMIPEIAGQTAGALGGAAIGALATGGAGAVGGGYAGQAVGSGIGTAARQKLAQWAGVEDPERDWKDRATDIGVSTLVGGLGPMAAEKVALPAIKWGAQKVKKVPVAIADAVIGVSPGRTAQIMGPEGPTIAKNAANIDDFAERAIPKAKEVADEVKGAIFDQYRRDTQNVIPRDALADTSGIAARLDQKIADLQLIDPKKAAKGPRIEALKAGKLRGIQSDTDAREILAYRDALDQVQTIDDALTLRANLDDAIDWTNGPAQIGKKAQGVLKTLRADVEKYIESAADVAGTGKQYRAAKEAYQRNVNTHGKLAKAFSDERVLSSLRNLDGAAKTQLRKAMNDAKQLVPNMADDIAELENYAAATEWTNFIKPIDVGRGLAGIGGGAVAAGAVNPVVGGLGYIATRPSVARTYLPKIGAVARTASSGAGRIGSAVSPALPPIRTAVATAAPRIASMEAQRQLPQIGNPSRTVEIDQSPRELMGDKWADAQQVITTAYGRDVKALIDAGESPEDATAQVLRALAQKHRYNAKNLPGTFAGVVKQVQAAAKEQYGQDITRSQAIELLAGAQ